MLVHTQNYTVFDVAETISIDKYANENSDSKLKFTYIFGILLKISFLLSIHIHIKQE